MKPYGRTKCIRGCPWKKDSHLHDKNHRKLEMWWEGVADYLNRTGIKRLWKKEIENEQ